MATIRVDGNDGLAVYLATQYARNYIIEFKKPALLEIMSYRIGDHSTSDASTLYRSAEELKSWHEVNNAILRFTKYLVVSGVMPNAVQFATDTRKTAREDVIRTLNECASVKLGPIRDLFDDVYEKLPQHLS